MGARVDDGTGLENRRTLCVPWVRIPPHPLCSFSVTWGVSARERLLPFLAAMCRVFKGLGQFSSEGLSASFYSDTSLAACADCFFDFIDLNFCEMRFSCTMLFIVANKSVDILGHEGRDMPRIVRRPKVSHTRRNPGFSSPKRTPPQRGRTSFHGFLLHPVGVGDSPSPIGKRSPSPGVR